MENNEPEEEVINFKEPDFTFRPNENHQWRQQGYYLVCKSCDIQHATWIGPDRLMVGMNERGQPIFQDRKRYEYKGNKGM